MTNESVRVTQADFDRAAEETNRLCRELDITNADHIALWIEHNTIPDEPMNQCAGWLACRIVEAHEAAVEQVRKRWTETVDALTDEIEVVRRHRHQSQEREGVLEEALLGIEAILQATPERSDVGDDLAQQQDQALIEIHEISQRALAAYRAALRCHGDPGANVLCSNGFHAPPAVSTDEVVADICRDVAELPDRTSPEDWPEAMLVTEDELRGIILSRLRGEGE